MKWVAIPLQTCWWIHKATAGLLVSHAPGASVMNFQCHQSLLYSADLLLHASWGFPGGSDSKDFACNVGEPGSIPGSGRSPGEGNGNPLQYSCLGNPMDRGAWWAIDHGVAKIRT